MKKLIFVGGAKGGSGKTTVSHALAHGLGSVFRSHLRVAVLTTDARARVRNTTGRTYVQHEARTGEMITRMIGSLRNRPEDGKHYFLIIDGAANAFALDQALHDEADLTIIPCKDSSEDHERVIQDFRNLPTSVILPNQWPTNTWAARAATRDFNTVFRTTSEDRERILPAVRECRSLNLLHCDLPRFQITVEANNVARQLAYDVLEKMGINPDDLRS